MKRSNFYSLLLCLCFSPLLLNACGGGTAGTGIDQLIIGSVITEDGAAVESVSIRIEEVGVSTMSDATGHFTLSAEVPEQFTLSFFKPDVVNDSLDLTSTEDVPLQGDFVVSEETGEVNFVEREPENVQTEDASPPEMQTESPLEVREVEESPITPTTDQQSPLEVDSMPIEDDNSPVANKLSIQGLIIDESGGQAKGVKVKISPLRLSPITDANGQFSLPEVSLSSTEQQIVFFASFTLRDGTSVIIDASAYVSPDTKFLGVIFRCTSSSALCELALVTESQSRWSSNATFEQAENEAEDEAQDEPLENEEHAEPPSLTEVEEVPL